MEWCILDTVSIDFTDIEVFLDFSHLAGNNVISNTPDSIAFCRAMLTSISLTVTAEIQMSVLDHPDFPRKFFQSR